MERPDLTQFPLTPGVYLYKNAQGQIIYVGKARRLRLRIASYFRNTEALPAKTRSMLQVAQRIDVLHTETEKEALLLEASLIKKHRPRYNISLRDDKEYLLFRIDTTVPFPRVEILRHSAKKRIRSKGAIFGPFSSGTAARTTWDLIHKHFPLRRCRDTTFANRTRPCLYYDMGQCLAPCVLPVNPKEYSAIIQKVICILSGRSRELVITLRKEMQTASDNLHFEAAAQLRDQIQALENTIEKQSVVLSPGTDLDLIGLSQTLDGAALGIVFVRDGLLLDGRTFFWPALTVEDTPELLYSFLTQYYLRDNINPPQRIIIPWIPDTDRQLIGNPSAIEERLSLNGEKENWPEQFQVLLDTLSTQHNAPVILSTPQNSAEDKLLIMAATNAFHAAKKSKRPPIGELLAKQFHTSTPINRIEAVDISHTGGQQTRAGMVVFQDEEPDPSSFRTYSLDKDLLEQQAERGDDYAALAAWAHRRIKAGPPYADLVLIDGGKGQLSAVHAVFRQAGLENTFILAGIAKARTEDGLADRRAGNVSDRIFIPNRSNPLPFVSGSAELLFLQRIRDMVHDYVLGKHRKARAKATLMGELSRLPGIGPQLAKALFSQFGSLAALAEADEAALRSVPGIGKQRAVLLKKRLGTLIQKQDK